MSPDVPKSKSPLPFFVLLFAISIPFWLAGILVQRFLPKSMPINLPFSALMVFNPMLAALILTYRETGKAGVKGLLQRAFDYRRVRNKIWYLPAFLLMPLLMVLEYAWIQIFGNPIPDPRLPVLELPIYFAMFFVGAIGEELGWQGYAYERLEEQWSALASGVVLGIVWAVWHIIPYIQAHNAPLWIIVHAAGSVGTRVLVVWIYNNTGKSVFAACIFHVMINMSTMLFPNYGSHYDPLIAVVIFAFAVAAVTAIWGHRTLARFHITG